MNVPCPHIGIKEIAEAWGVNTMTVRRWLSDEGIRPIQHGRYSQVDLIRYSEKYGKPKLSKIENIKLIQLEKENQNLRAEITELKKCLFKIAELSAGNMQKLLQNNLSKEGA